MCSGNDCKVKALTAILGFSWPHCRRLASTAKSSQYKQQRKGNRKAVSTTEAS